MILICVEYGPAACLAWNKIKVHFLNTLSCIAIFHICYISGEELKKTTDHRPLTHRLRTIYERMRHGFTDTINAVR